MLKVVAADLAPRRRRQGRPRRGGRAHRRPRPGRLDALPPRVGNVAQAGPDPAPVAHAHRQARAGARGLVEAVTWSFIGKSRRRAVRRRCSRRWRSPIRSPPTLRHAAQPAAGPVWRRSATPTAAIADPALFEVGQIFRGVRPSDQKSRSPLPAFGARSAGVGGSGRHWQRQARKPSPCSTRNRMRWRCSMRSAYPGRADADRRRRAGLVPSRAARARSSSGRKNVIGHFGEFHPTTLEALDVEGPLAGCEIVLDAHDARRAFARPAPSRRSCSDGVPARLVATSPSSSIGASQAGRIAQGGAGGGEASSIDRRVRLRYLRGAGASARARSRLRWPSRCSPPRRRSPTPRSRRWPARSSPR
jgi:hypothetical protein